MYIYIHIRYFGRAKPTDDMVNDALQEMFYEDGHEYGGVSFLQAQALSLSRMLSPCRAFSVAHTHSRLRSLSRAQEARCRAFALSAKEPLIIGLFCPNALAFALLQCVTVCYSVLHCVTVCCSMLQCVKVCYSVLQCVTVCYSVLQCVAVCCSVLQCVTVCYSVLQCVAVCCSVS